MPYWEGAWNWQLSSLSGTSSRAGTSICASRAREAEQAETTMVREMEKHPSDGTHHLKHSRDLEIQLDLSLGTYE